MPTATAVTGRSYASLVPRDIDGRRAVLAYIPVPHEHPHLGGAAIVGVVHGPEETSLMGWAVENNPPGYGTMHLARWLVCVGWSTRVVGHPSTRELPATDWSVELTRSIDLDQAYCGHTRLCVGRVELEPEHSGLAQQLLA